MKLSKFLISVWSVALILLPAGAGLAADAAPASVTLVSFSASVEERAVVVRWETATERDTLGYHLHRQALGGELIRVNADLIPGQVPPGNALGTSYEFVDPSVEVGGTYDYWLEIVATDHQNSWEGPVSVEVVIIGNPVPPGPTKNLYRVFLPAVNN